MKYFNFFKSVKLLLWHLKCCGFFIFSLLFCISAHADNEYKFGVFPYMPPQKIEKVWGPLVLHLSEQLGKKIQLRSRASYGTFRNEIENEYFDIAFMQPFVYADIASKHNYIPIARFVSLQDKNNQGRLKAIFVTLNKNKNMSIADLKNQTIATPPSTSAVSILGKLLLLENGLVAGRDFKISSHINHHSCLQQLLINKPIVCITAHPPFARFNTDNYNRLSIMTSTRSIPSSVIAIHKRMLEGDREKIKNILLHLKGTLATRNFLKKAKLSGFIEARDADYDEVRKISHRLNK